MGSLDVVAAKRVRNPQRRWWCDATKRQANAGVLHCPSLHPPRVREAGDRESASDASERGTGGGKMSIPHLKAVFASKGISGTPRTVLLALANRASDGSGKSKCEYGWSFAGYAQLMLDSG